MRATLATGSALPAALALTCPAFHLRAELPLCREGAAIRFAGRQVTTDQNGEASLRMHVRGRGRKVAVATSTICEPAPRRGQGQEEAEAPPP